MILITGATGHIGNVLARELIAAGEQVRALILPGESTLALEGLPVECVSGDVTDLDSLIPAFKDVRVVYHLAAMISIWSGQEKMIEQVNFIGTQNIILMTLASQARLIYCSSIHALSRIPHGTWVDESVPFDPDHAISAYDRSKAQASLAVQRATRAGLDATIVCPTGVIGPYDFRGSEIGRLIQSCMKPGWLYNLKDAAYDFVDVRDVARGMILACQQGQVGEVYILSGERISMYDLMKQVQAISGVRSSTIHVSRLLAKISSVAVAFFSGLMKKKPYFTPYAVETVFSNSMISHRKATEHLGYQPRSLQHAIRDTINWFQQNLKKKRLLHPPQNTP